MEFLTQCESVNIEILYRATQTNVLKEICRASSENCHSLYQPIYQPEHSLYQPLCTRSFQHNENGCRGPNMSNQETSFQGNSSGQIRESYTIHIVSLSQMSIGCLSPERDVR